MNKNQYAKQRQPKRFMLIIPATILILLGALLTATFVGALIGIPLILIGGIILLLRLTIKVHPVECPHCKAPNKVELNVQRFNCTQCSKTLYTENNEWVVV